MNNYQSMLRTTILEILDSDIGEDNFQEAVAAQACLMSPDEVGLYCLD